ncbi:unnamed protein product [Brassica oleracea]
MLNALYTGRVVTFYSSRPPCSSVHCMYSSRMGFFKQFVPLLSGSRG